MICSPDDLLPAGRRTANKLGSWKYANFVIWLQAKIPSLVACDIKTRLVYSIGTRRPEGKIAGDHISN